MNEASDPLSRLQREHRRHCWIGAGLLSALMVWVGIHSHAPHRVVSAERWELRDKAGRVRALMGSETGGTPQLSFFDEEGHNLVQITAYPHAPELSLSSYGHPRLLISGLESGGVLHLLPTDVPGPGLILSPAREGGPSDWPAGRQFGREVQHTPQPPGRASFPPLEALTRRESL